MRATFAESTESTEIRWVPVRRVVTEPTPTGGTERIEYVTPVETAGDQISTFDPADPNYIEVAEHDPDPIL